MTRFSASRVVLVSSMAGLGVVLAGLHLLCGGPWHSDGSPVPFIVAGVMVLACVVAGFMLCHVPARLFGVKGATDESSESDATAGERRLADQALTALATSLAHLSGKPFFEAVCRQLSETLNIDRVYVGQLTRDLSCLEVVGGWSNGAPMGEVDYQLTGTPCANVMASQVCVHQRGVAELFPGDRALAELNIQAYVGAPVFDKNNRPIGVLVALHTRPIEDPEPITQLFRVYLDRVSAEMQRTQTEHALQESEARFRRLFDQAVDAVFVHGMDGRLIDVNSVACASLGYTREELLSMSVFDIETHWTTDELRSVWRQAVTDGTNTLEGRHRRKDGTEFPMEARVSLFATGGEPLVIASVRDISARKATEAALQRENMLLEAVINGLPGIFHMFDRTGRMYRWNEEYLRVLDYTPEAAATCNALDRIPSNDVQRMLTAVERAFREGMVHMESGLLTRDGLKDYHFVARRVTIDGQDYVVGSGYDVTDRVRAQEQLNVSRQRLMMHVEQTPLGVIEFDVEGYIRDWNPAATTMFGFSHDEAVGQHWRILVPEVLWDKLDNIWRAIVERRGGSRSTNANRTRDGRTIQSEWFNTPLISPDGEVIGVASLVMDITQRLRAEDDLRRARDEAQAASRAKDVFLASASHELRTPLTPVLLLASAWERDPTLPPELRQDLSVIREHVEIEKRLVDDLLDFTAIHAGKLQLELRPTRLHEVLQAAIQTCRPEIDRKQLCFRTSLEAQNDTVLVDAGRLRQIFWNLLLNAAKFTPALGQVSVSTSVTGDGQIQVAFTDTGRGIDRETMARIFRPFEQGPRTDIQHHGGLGLGLAIARTIAVHHGGTVEAHSPGPNLGTTVVLRLPLAPQDIPADLSAGSGGPPAGIAPLPVGLLQAWQRGATDTADPSDDGLRILVVEDHAQTREAIGNLLQKDHHLVTAVGSVAQARAALHHSPYDVLLSDIGLPDGSGLELLEAALQTSRPVAIAISGYSSAADRETALQAGFAEHIAKPVSIDTLRETIARVVESSVRIDG